MLALERRQIIKDKLKEHGSVIVEELAKEMKVTRMTIRRDLDKLDSQEFSKRTYGGAVLIERLVDEEDYDVRKEKNIETKKKIALEANMIIQENSTILLDAGTTTYELAHFIKNRSGHTIITGNLKIATLLYKTRNEVYFIGGKIEKKTGTVMTADCVSFIEQLNIDYAFIGGSAISNDFFLTTPTFEKAKLKSKITKTANKSILLADKSKFGIKSLVKIAHISDFDTIITDFDFIDEVKKELTDKDVDLRII